MRIRVVGESRVEKGWLRERRAFILLLGNER